MLQRIEGITYKRQRSRWANIKMGKINGFVSTCEKRKLKSFDKYIYETEWKNNNNISHHHYHHERLEPNGKADKIFCFIKTNIRKTAKKKQTNKKNGNPNYWKKVAIKISNSWIQYDSLAQTISLMDTLILYSAACACVKSSDFCNLDLIMFHILFGQLRMPTTTQTKKQNSHTVTAAKHTN